MWGGIYKLLLGKKGHANWHFTDEKRPRPSKLAMFVLRSENPAWYEVLAWRLEESPLRPFMRLIALGYEFEAWTELPHTLRDLVVFVPHLLVALGRCVLRRPAQEAEEEADAEGSELNDEAAGRQEQFRKRLCAAAGLLGIYVVWTIFSWFIFACTAPACMHARMVTPRILTHGNPFIRWHAHIQAAGFRRGAGVCESMGRWLCYGQVRHALRCGSWLLRPADRMSRWCPASGPPASVVCSASRAAAGGFRWRGGPWQHPWH